MLVPPDRTRNFPSGGLLLAIAIVAAMAGGALTVAVSKGWTAGVDRTLLLAIRGSGEGQPPAGPLWFQEAVRDVTALGSMIVLAVVVLSAIAFLVAAARHRLAALLAVSTLAATAYSTALKLLFDRPRPDIVDHGMATFTASFPSGHALLSAAILLTNGGLLAFAARQKDERWVIGGAAILLTTAVGLSRVYLGVHWPSDVLAGWLFGTVWACLTLFLARVVEPFPRPPRYD